MTLSPAIKKPSTILFEGVVGSKAYGIDSQSSDTDLKGVCLGPIDMYLGLQGFEQYENPHQDEVIYELKKFVRLALNSNPSVIELLWLPEYSYMHPLGRKLVDIRQSFLSIKAHKAFSGYAVGQIKKCWAKAEDPTCHAGIKAKNPYKHAAHCLRLVRMGREILTDGQIIVNRSGQDAEELKAVRRGEVPLDEVVASAEALLVEVDELAKTSSLPKEPDYRTVENTVKDILWSYLMEEMLK